MNESVANKLGDASSVPGVKKGKYSWLEDACVWFHIHKMTNFTVNSEVLPTQTRGSVEARINKLYSVENAVRTQAADLSDKENVSLWSDFINYKCRENGYESRFVPQMNEKTIAILSRSLNIASDILLTRLERIRDTKHYLYFSGIHLNEDSSLNEYVVTRRIPTPHKVNDVPKRSGNFSLGDQQALYKFQRSIDLTYTVGDLARDRNKSVEAIKHGLRNLFERTIEVEHIVHEGVTLLWGSDTDLWHDYTTRHTVGTTHPASISLSNAISGLVARDRNISPLYTHFRLNLVRNLKKLLHIAGIHEDTVPSTHSSLFRNQRPNALFCSESPTGDVKVQDSSASLASSTLSPVEATDWRINNHMRFIVSEVLQSTVNALVLHEQIAASVQDALEEKSTTIIADAEVSTNVSEVINNMINAVVLVSTSTVETEFEEENSCTTNNSTVLHQEADLHEDCGIFDSFVTEREPEVTAELPLPVSLVTGVSCSTPDSTPDSPRFPSDPIFEISITKNSLRSSICACSTATTLDSDVTTGGAGNLYTIQEDRIIWQAWLQYGIAGRAACAAQLQRTPNAIRKRIKHLVTMSEEAEQAVNDGTTLLPTNTELQLWWGYCALHPLMQSQNSVYIDPSAVVQLASEHRTDTGEMVKHLQAIRAIKWFLDISDIHKDKSVAEPVPETIQTTTTRAITEAIEAASNRPVPCLPLLLPDALPVAPFAFSLPNDADIWCAYVKSLLPTSHKLLPSRLQKLAGKMGCTFAHAKERLSELVNLNIGLTEQFHSSGRPFSNTEDSILETELLNNSNSNNRPFGDILANVALKLRCSVGAVALRSRQLKTLRLLDEVENRVHAKQNTLVINESPISPPALPPPLEQPHSAHQSLLAQIDAAAHYQSNATTTANSFLIKRPSPDTDNDNDDSSSAKIARTSPDHACNYVDDDGGELGAHFTNGRFTAFTGFLLSMI